MADVDHVIQLGAIPDARGADRAAVHVGDGHHHHVGHSGQLFGLQVAGAQGRRNPVVMAVDGEESEHQHRDEERDDPGTFPELCEQQHQKPGLRCQFQGMGTGAKDGAGGIENLYFIKQCC